MASLLSIQYKSDMHQQRQPTYVLEHNRSRLSSKASLNTNSSTNRLAYVDALVDVNASVIESIWQLPTANNKNSVVPLRTFIQEVLKRSRTTYSTLQTALFYLFRSKPEIVMYLAKMRHQSCWEDAYVSCGRRMFLASLVVASKFVQDKTYRNSAWAKIAGLPVSEVNAAERIFLNMIDHRLYISQPVFEHWHRVLHMHVEAKTLHQPTSLLDFSDLMFAAHPLKEEEAPTSYTYHQYHYHHHSPSLSPASPCTNQYKYQKNQHGWTIALSPAPCECQPSTKKRRRKTSIQSITTCYCQQMPPLPALSLPSSISSSPMQTPSPTRMNNSNGIPVFNWTSPPTMNKKRKLTIIESNHHCPRSYNISHVRQQSKD
ncbi:hypothetical protein EDC96DRAFT_576501 [Choanephora cucurbitarum]|nr:hypothetical protein EDC96DRAFT_576501 [Choanephora cucurbitarum]